MPTPKTFATLRNTLAELYPDDASMKRVAGDAGINITRIAFGSSAINNWQAILSEAERANKVSALLDVVLGEDEYGDNPKLRQATETYRASVEQGSDSDKTSPRSAGTTINTGGGAYVAGNIYTSGNFVGRDETMQAAEVEGTDSKPVVTPANAWPISYWLQHPLNLTIGLVGSIITIIAFITGVSSLRGFFSTNHPQPAITQASSTTAITASPFQSTTPLTNTPIPTMVASTTITKINPRDGAVYVWIPPGEFTMGSSITNTVTISNERPLHEVVLDGFWIMQTEVTNAQYKRCMDDKKCEKPNNDRWNDPIYANYPVANIIWSQAKTYSDWTGGRLPSEAEWEKACRGTDGRIYSWGNELPTSKRLNYLESKKLGTMPVGTYPQGTNILYDMAGNVWEWTADWYDEKYYTDSLTSNPKGADSGEFRTLRGGSFGNSANFVRCTNRNNYSPISENSSVGFRVVTDGF